MGKMKDSGISFVGKIPVNWCVEKNKHCFEFTKDIIGKESSNVQLLSLTKKGIICKDLNYIGGKTPESFDTYQKVNKVIFRREYSIGICNLACRRKWITKKVLYQL